jgi:hypothetical protein
VISLARDGSIRILDLGTEYVQVGGSVSDPYRRRPPAKLESAVIVGTTVVSLDERGSIVSHGDIGSNTMIAANVGFDNSIVKVSAEAASKAVSVMSRGTDILWTKDSLVLVGGRSLVAVDLNTQRTVLFHDTTTAFTHFPDGELFSAFRTVRKKLPADTGFVAMPPFGDTAAVIGTLRAVGDSILFAGLRGYTQIVNDVDTILRSGGVWRSTDRGSTWNQLQLPFGMEMVLDIAIRKEDQSIWVSGTRVTRETEVQTDSSGSTNVLSERISMDDLLLVRSYDHGQTWSTVHQVPYAGPFIASTCNVVLRGSRQVVWVTPDKLNWSDDDGINWRIAEGIPGLTSVVTHAVYDEQGTWWVTSSEGLFKADPINVSVDETESESDGINEPTSRSTPIFWANTFPNPTDRTFTLRLYNLDRLKGPVDQLEIVDLLGRSVLDLRPHTYGARPTGTVDIPLDLGTDAAGLYLLVGRTSDRAFTWPMWVY